MKYPILFFVIFLVASSPRIQAQQGNTQGQKDAGQGQQAGNQSNQQPRQQVAPESTEWYYPVPPKVQPGVGTSPPSDAIILFDGKDLSQWKGRDNATAQWTVKEGQLIVEP